MTELVNGSASSPKLTPVQRRQLCRALAVNEVTRAQLARDYGVSRPAITQFAKRHGTEIEAIKARLDDEFAGLWIADKGNRLAAYQGDYDLSAEGEYAAHYEQIRTRTQILHNVAEELGQLPPRATVAVLPVVHVIRGDVDLDALT